MKKVWILNHYATGMYTNQGGRHYWFAENLIKQGYEPHIFCSNIRHSIEETFSIDKGNFVKKIINEIPFVFIETTPYKKNGFDRVKNMFSFYKNMFPVGKHYAEKYGKPDVILASSVHPLTLVAGIKIAKKFGVPCICEVRDLWPESIVAYGALSRKNIVTKLLYQGEKWIYKRADSIIMTWEGGVDYIKDQGWENVVDLSKVYHINNGIVIDSFDKNSEINKIEDSDLNNKKYKNVVYAGSIRKVNNIGLLLDTAKVINSKGKENIRILIYGDGNELELLKKRCIEENITNLIFKGKVEKKYVPSILKQADINILHNSSTILDKYGQSQNKFFEYLAAGKCIVQTYSTGYSLCERYDCGISASFQSAEEIAKSIIIACNDEEEARKMGENARDAAHDFEFKKLTQQLINVIENV